LAATAGSEDLMACPACGASHHRECWEENGGCAVYGCVNGPVIEKRRDIEVPVSHWGREQKPCPSCGQEILAAALRCRHCGATFASAQPENTTEFQLRTLVTAGLQEARVKVRWIFFVSIFPFTAAIGAVWGWWWQRENPETMHALPVLDRALLKIGLIAAVVQTAALIILTALYIAVRGH
jgi:predicted RNA-binding Zn-ribbon protein involved in translation (DUF1610 family)